MDLYIPRFFSASDESFFILGPRGTGKSTFLNNQYPSALWLDLLRPDVFRYYVQKPERIIEQVHENSDKNIVIVDEIQKVPDLMIFINRLIEEKTDQQYILTASSIRKLKKTSMDLIKESVLIKTIHPFLISEVIVNIPFDKILRFGLLPIVISSNNPKSVLDNYVTLYVRAEVQIEGLVRNIGNFFRFLEAVSFSHGSIINISSVARECEVERKVVEGYIKILEDVLLAFRIPVLNKKAKRELISHPKFYFFDTGVFRSLRPKGPFDRPGEIDDAALEGLIAQNLRAWNAYQDNPYQIYFWRTRGGVEVDFVLYKEDEIYAIDVINTARVRPEDLRSLMAFRDDYPQSKALLLYRGKEKVLKNDVLCVPCENFLRELFPDRSFPL